MKPVSFLGDSLDAIRSFPNGPRREAGYQIDRVHRGLDPDDWKPMKTVGPGVLEIRIRDAAVYVLHAFQKKSQATAKGDIERAIERFKRLMWRVRQ